MDEKLPPPSPQEQEQTLERERITRRTFMMNVGIALNAIVGVAIATPVVVYLLGPVLRRKEYRQWISLGDVTEFPAGETKLVTYRNPYRDSWDGATDNVPAYVRCTAPGSLWCLRLIARTWDVRCGGSRSRSCLCVRATEGCITPMEAELRDRRSEDFSPMRRRLRTGS